MGKARISILQLGDRLCPTALWVTAGLPVMRNAQERRNLPRLPPGSRIHAPRRGTVEQYSFYCDESGNSGPNYIDDQQPYYVVGGFLLPDRYLPDIAVFMELLRQRFAPQAPELKAKTLRGRRGVDCVRRMFEALGRFDALPAYVIAEKRYCVAAKIIDTFLDPLYNERLQHGFSLDIRTKRELAVDLHRVLSVTTLNLFADAYRVSTPDALEKALDLVVLECRSRVNPEVATLLDGCRSHVQSIAESEGWHTGGDLDGINLPALLTLFQLIDGIAHSGDLHVSKFVQDQTATHEAAYRQAFMTSQNIGDHVIRFPNGAPTIGGLKSIRSFETQESIHSPFIQAADLLVGTIALTCKSVDKEQILTGPAAELNSLLFTPVILVDPPKLAWTIVSDQFLHGLSRTLGWKDPDADLSVEQDPASLLPATGANRPDLPAGRRITLPSPMWGLRRHDGSLLVLQQAVDPTSPDRDVLHALPIFSTENHAQEFVTRYCSGEDLRVEMLDPDASAMRSLVFHLQQLVETVQALVVDPSQSHSGSIVFADFVGTMTALVGRLERARSAGIMDVLHQEHVVDGTTFITALLSSGEYGGAERETMQFVTAPTRDDALRLAVEQFRMARDA